jgi:hypothetical protein
VYYFLEITSAIQVVPRYYVSRKILDHNIFYGKRNNDTPLNLTSFYSCVTGARTTNKHLLDIKKWPCNDRHIAIVAADNCCRHRRPLLSLLPIVRLTPPPPSHIEQRKPRERSIYIQRERYCCFVHTTERQEFFAAFGLTQHHSRNEDESIFLCSKTLLSSALKSVGHYSNSRCSVLTSPFC